MRIDLNQGPQATLDRNRSTAQTNAAVAGAAALTRTQREDPASLSGAQVEALAAQAAQPPEMRQEKVQALRQALLGGEYDVNPERVASAMFAETILSPSCMIGSADGAELQEERSSSPPIWVWPSWRRLLRLMAPESNRPGRRMKASDVPGPAKMRQSSRWLRRMTS